MHLSIVFKETLAAQVAVRVSINIKVERVFLHWLQDISTL